MIAELGNYALALSLAIAVLLAIFPLWGAEKGNVQFMALARPMTYGLFLILSVSFGALFYVFAINDFSVQYVVNNSNTTLPIYYRLSAVWGSHEGSLLLWIWLLSLWSAAYHKKPPLACLVSWGLSVLASCFLYCLPPIRLPVHFLTFRWTAKS